MEQKHTRIPWQVTTDAKNEFFWVESLNVAELVASETTQANAELIVTAVNNHDELVEALKRLITASYCIDNIYDEDSLLGAAENAEQVLSKLPQ